jgi:hypothetical protein
MFTERSHKIFIPTTGIILAPRALGESKFGERNGQELGGAIVLVIVLVLDEREQPRTF